MQVRLKLRPGMRGTKKLVAKYGDRLVCVRYRYDAERGKRYKTVELIEEEADWVPPGKRITPDTVVGVRVDVAELALRQQVKSAGGWWNSYQKVWELRYEQVEALGLLERMVELRKPEGGR